MAALELALPEGSWTRHGFPRGVRFVPTKLELVALLSDRIRGRPFPRPFDGVFHDVRILDHHPARLYEAYRGDAENGSVYFFSRREFRSNQGPAAAGKKKKEAAAEIPRPVRGANGGGWKASGGARPLYWGDRRKGGVLAGRMVTLVFYDHVPGTANKLAKSNWGLHEFTVPVQDRLRRMDSKTRFRDLALYRLYTLKSGDDKETDGAAAAGISSEDDQAANVPEHHVAFDACSGGSEPSTSTAMAPWLGHCGGVLTTNQALAAAASSTASQQLSLVPQAKYYQQIVYALAAEAAGDDQKQAHTAPVHGAGFPSQLQFTSPLAPEPPAAEIPPAQLPPETATHGEGQEAGHFVVPTSPSSAPAAGSPPAHDHIVDCVKPLEEAVPPPLDLDALPAAQDECHKNITVPAHEEFLECVKPLEEAMPPPPPPPPPMEDIVPAAQDGSIMAVDAGDAPWPDFSFSASIGDLFPYDELIMFPIEDYMGISMMEGDGSSGGGEKNGQAGGGNQLQQEPPATFA